MLLKKECWREVSTMALDVLSWGIRITDLNTGMAALLNFVEMSS
jgi:hypothetical protein